MYYMSRHMDLHRSSNFTCRFCKNIFNNKTELEKHYMVEHPTKTPYHCNTCEEDFMTELFLTKHMTKCKVTTGKNNVDDELNNSTDEVTDLQYRMKLLRGFNYSTVSKIISRNISMDQFFCAACCRMFSSKNDLRAHFRRDHMIESNSLYICQVCDIEKPTCEMMCAHLEVHSLNTLSVNRFSGLRGSYVKPRKSRQTNTNVFPNLASVKIEKPHCEEVVDEVKQKLFSKFKVGSEVKFKPRRTNNLYKKNYFAIWLEKTKWMRNSGRRYNKATSKINKVNPPIQQMTQTTTQSLVNEEEDVSSGESEVALQYQGRARRQRLKRVHGLKDEGESKNGKTSTSINKSNKQRRVGKVKDNDELKDNGASTSNTVKSNRQRRTRRLYEVENEDELKVEGDVTTNIDKSTGDLMSESDSDNSPEIKENVEFILKKLSNDLVDEKIEGNILSNSCNIDTNDIKQNNDETCQSLVVNNNIPKVSEDYGLNNFHEKSCSLGEEEINSKSEVDIKVLPAKIIKITKSTPQKRVVSYENVTKLNDSFNLASESSEVSQGEEASDDIPVYERGEAICCTMCSMPFYNQDELLDHVATHI